ncbi:MAG: complex I subunit 4 family protein, partial [Candidatus Binatia bacterium]
MASTFSGDLTLLIFLPTLGAFLLLGIPRQATGILFKTALLLTTVTFLWSLRILWAFDPSQPEVQLVDRAGWIPAYGIDYFVAIDGLNLFLVLLTTLLAPLVILASWTVTERVKEYLFFMLLLETGMIGAFVALDLFLFYVFWEVTLIPMYFIIGVWGGPRRVYAAVKFVLYTMSGSLLMLIAIIYIAVRHADLTQNPTFDLLRIQALSLPYEEQFWLFLAFTLAFAIKVPMFPLHTWLPDAHVEAPTAGSVILAGVMLKMGTYGLLRFAIPLFPEVTLSLQPFLIALAVIGIVYGALVAMMQSDLKRLVAYSSVSHLGLVVLGLFALNANGLEGALYQMLNHGLSTGA